MRLGILLRVAPRLSVDYEVAVALLVQRDVLGLVVGDFGKAHPGEQLAQQGRVRSGIFDELEAVGAHRIVEAEDRLFGGLSSHQRSPLCRNCSSRRSISRRETSQSPRPAYAGVGAIAGADEGSGARRGSGYRS